MCGITGIVNKNSSSPDRELLLAMTNVLAHRGPDASGIFINNNVGLGHRRLSIIDTSTAATQPMLNSEKTIALVFNGEIYNFHEIRQRLIKRGHTFNTLSDTEVIIHAWTEYGVDCLTHFRGMFAFILYDKVKELIFVARDRLGKKPLFYCNTDTKIYFASEIKSIIKALDPQRRDIDQQALIEYVAYGHSVGERTIYQGIRKLLPGCYMLLKASAGSFTVDIKRYWRFELKSDYQISEEEWLEEMDSVLSESVRLRMISDVPLGAFLSGGIDSSLVVAYMTKHQPEGVKTFTIGFNESEFDESKKAADVASHFNTVHKCKTLTPSATNILSQLIDSYDEPFADQSAIPTFLLSQFTREHVTVALSGDGGDEFFLGYTRYPQALKTMHTSNLLPSFGKLAVSYAAKMLPFGFRGKRTLERLSLSPFDQYHHIMGYSSEFLSLLKPELLLHLKQTEQSKLWLELNKNNELSYQEKCQLLDIYGYLPDDILVKVDRASMHYSLEVRCPLLDHKFVELSSKIPASLKLHGSSTKYLLKKLASRYIPKTILDKPKQGFGIPLNQWFKQELAPLLQELTVDQNSLLWDYFDYDVVCNRISGHMNYGIDSSVALWRLLYFYQWINKQASPPH